jgi:PKD repeat protein
MNRLTKAAIVALMLAIVPLKLWAQTPYRQYADEGIMLNFFEIDNHDFRLFLLYNLDQDDRFVVTLDEQYGIFILTPNSDGQENDFLETFETFYNNAYADFRVIDKVFLQDLVVQWKSSVPPTHFASITMDLALSRAITLNNHCVDSDPFCTSDLIQFQAATTSQTADQLEGADFDDGCIGSSYNPSWYHMRINTPGQFIIHMEGRDPNSGVERDIDFCMWGPFHDPTAPCVAQLTTDKIIDCNYSSHYSEDIYLGFPENEHHHQASHGTINYHMPETGEYYIAMICNFSRQPCVITFTKTEGSGPGTTDCGILPGIASNSGPYCVGETIQLTVTTQAGATYSWTGPNGYTSNVQNPSIPNCTFDMGGTYTCVTMVDGQTTTGSTEVVVFAEPVADFEAPAVCFGETTQFINTAHTDPIGHEITAYHWDFDDGEESDEQDVTHTYAEAGTYQVTLTVETGRGRCTNEITKTVTVYAQPIADAGVDQSLPYPGLTAQLSGSGGGDGFTYRWEPANMVVNPNNRNTETVILMETQQYVLTVTNPQGGCTSMDTMYVYIGTAPLNVEATASPDALCLGDNTQLHVDADGGSGDFTYSWTSSPSGFTSNQQNPVVTPTQTTTYTCTVTDNITTDHRQKNVTVTVNMPKTLDSDTITGACDVYTVTWPDEQGNEQAFTFYENGFHKFEGLTVAGCHLEKTFYIEDMQYTPSPLIYDTIDSNPEYPITATEFSVNSYTYQVKERWKSDISKWDFSKCKWEISKDSWRIVTDENDPLQCIVYPMDWVPDSILLSFIAVNDCGSDTAKYWLHPSFYGIEENEAYPAAVSIIPNPNNGQMQLKFENMEGRLSIKVYNSTGILVDSFEIQSSYGETYNYSAKRLNNGIYFFNITDGKRAVTKKVVILN